MLALDDRALAVFAHAWSLLPSVKSRAYLTAIGTSDLGARNGSYLVDEGRLVVNSRLFGQDTPQSIPLFDINSSDPPSALPCCSRVLATTLHEMAHAIGAGTGLDTASEWLALGGWQERWDDPPNTGRRWENRPGWDIGASSWCYRTGTFFLRDYSSKTPMEDFADCCTHLALGWLSSFTSAPPATRVNAMAKLAYLRREVWGEKGMHGIHAARQRWQAARQPRQRKPSTDDEAALVVLLLAWIDEHPAITDQAEAADALTLAIAPSLLRAYKHQWRAVSATTPVITTEVIDAIHHAATSFLDTTAQRLAQGRAPETAARARLLATTELHRMAQAATQAAWEASGDVAYKVWHTTSVQPCSFCEALEGTRIAVGETFFAKGATVTDAKGKTMTLDYEAIMHPPLHINCACVLERE